jgi:hypothetical protein
VRERVPGGDVDEDGREDSANWVRDVGVEGSGGHYREGKVD